MANPDPRLLLRELMPNQDTLTTPSARGNADPLRLGYVNIPDGACSVH